MPAVTVTRLCRFLLSSVSVLLLVLVPSADLVAFGLHEHVTAEGSFGLAGAESTPDLPLSHHCELSVSVGELIPVVELPTPVSLMGEPPNPRALYAQHRPFVPLPPPRT